MADRLFVEDVLGVKPARNAGAHKGIRQVSSYADQQNVDALGFDPVNVLVEQVHAHGVGVAHALQSQHEHFRVGADAAFDGLEAAASLVWL